MRVAHGKNGVMRNYRSFLGSILTVILLLSALALLAVPTWAQSTSPSPNIVTALQNVFDARDTNSLMNADEINVSPMFKYNAESHRAGGALKLDWWVTDQQGAFFTFEEYGDRSAYWSLGYQARTVFKGIELSLGAGTRQNTSDPLGDVKLFIEPTITKQIFHKGDWDIRLAVGCDILNSEKPNPFFAITFRAVKF